MNLREIDNPNPYVVGIDNDDDIKKELDEVHKLARFGDSNSFDFWYGIISGFPLCCIDYFINEWSYTIRDIYDEVRTYENNHLQQSTERTMCPNCILEKLLPVNPI